MNLTMTVEKTTAIGGWIGVFSRLGGRRGADGDLERCCNRFNIKRCVYPLTLSKAREDTRTPKPGGTPTAARQLMVVLRTRVPRGFFGGMAFPRRPHSQA